MFEKLFARNVLFYPGCLAKLVAKEVAENYRKILGVIGIDFIELKQICCGSPCLNAGYSEEAKELAEKVLKLFREHGVRKIITSCPACFKTFSQDYPRILGDRWNFEVEHVCVTILNTIKNGKLKLRKIENVKATYHDPCHLGRYCNIYEEPREILRALGFELVEMKFSRENSFCCGGGSGVKANFPELANEIAKDRIEQAKETQASVLITTCPLCYLNLKENSEGIKVKELSEVLVESI
jgi:Fe-S oxidoreductase